MLPADLQAYPQLNAVFGALNPQPALAGLPIAELHDGGVARNQLNEVEDALGALGARPAADLAEQRGKLFIAGWHHWDATWLELLAFSTYHRDGILQHTGWPLDPRYGGSPPFDGVVEDRHGQDALIAFDVKSAAGSGIGLLKERFQPAANRWAARHQLGAVDVGVQCRGLTPTCERLGLEIGRMLAAIGVALQPQATLPATFTYRMPTGGTVTATIDAAGGVIMSGWVGGGRQASIEAVMRDHVRDKAVFAARHDRPFFLVYVRPSGAGAADLRPQDVAAAARALDAAGASDWWLGTVLLDFAVGALARHGHIRNNGRWPQGASAQTLARTLGL